MIWYSNNFIRYIYVWKLQFLTKAILLKKKKKEKKEEKVDFPQTNFGCPFRPFGWLVPEYLMYMIQPGSICLSFTPFILFVVCQRTDSCCCGFDISRWRNYLLQYKKYIECSKYFSCAKLKYKIHVIHSGHPGIKVNYLPCDKLAWYEHFSST